MLNRALAMLAAFSFVAVLIPRLPYRNSRAADIPRECWEIRDELVDAVERGQLTWEQIKPIIKRCNKVEFK